MRKINFTQAPQRDSVGETTNRALELSSLVDSHCHLPLIRNKDEGTKAVIDRAVLSGIEHMLCVCVDLETFEEIQRISSEFSMVSGTVGTHPNNGQDTLQPSADDLITRASDKNIIAVGETGLDYFYDRQTSTAQKELFHLHIEAAKKAKKPLIVHCRDSAGDLLDILKAENARDVGGIMHCFVENWEVAKQALDMGFYISFSGIVTFKNAKALRDVAIKIPPDRILVETDSPWLTPVPHRGKQNEPSFLQYTVECLATIRKTAVQDFADLTAANFYNLFPQAKKEGHN